MSTNLNRAKAGSKATQPDVLGSEASSTDDSPLLSVTHTSSDETDQARSLALQPGRNPLRRRPADGAHQTRISGAWTAVAVAVVLGVALIDFIVENTRHVRIDFFGAHGHIPVAVALLAAALTGAAVVLAVGICRTTQLRLALRRRKRKADAEFLASDVDGNPRVNVPHG